MNKKAAAGALLLMFCSCSVPPPEALQRTDKVTLSDLSVEEKVGQMFMVRYTGNFYRNDAFTFRDVRRLITERHLGGMIPYFGSVHGTIANLNELQSVARIPLLVAADYERGVGQHLDGGTLFPTNMAMAATGDLDLAYEQGKITAIEARAVGVHVTFAPVMDVNSNPENPIINFRSYGDSPEIASKFGIAFIKGAQDHSLIACAKHFPGHGDTGVDSHTTLPVIESDEATFRKVDLSPFKDAVNSGVKMVMTAHIAIPVLDDSRLPATLSHKLSEQILRDEFGFDGIIVTDAMEMGGITEAFWSGEAAVRTIEAGSDIVLLPLDNDTAIDGVLKAVRSGRISEERIDRSVQKILDAKQELGLWRQRTVSIENARETLGKWSNKSSAGEAASKSITLVKDEEENIPISPGESKRLSHILLATDEGMLSYSRPFRSAVSRLHGNVKSQFHYQPLTDSQIMSIVAGTDSSDQVLASLLIRVRMNIGSITIDPSHRALIDRLQETGKKVTVVSFGSPYVTDVDGIGTYLAAYGYGSVSMSAMANALFGGASLVGELPVNLSPTLHQGFGMEKKVGKTFPMTEKMPDLSTAEAVLESAIGDSIFPGASAVVLSQGNISWTYQVGRHTYDNASSKVSSKTIYDLASLTKVVATTGVVMKLVAQKKLPLDERVKDFIPQFTGGGKELVTVRHLLTHSAGLTPFDEYPLGTTEEAIVKDILERPLIYEPGTAYKYSDFGPILTAKICELVTGQSFDALASSLIFKPLVMKSTFFNPDSSLLIRMAPTEIDSRYGRGLVHGLVHDERAWQLGGVAGHAGLFSTAEDLAVYAQMMMDSGFFGGRRHFSRSIIDEFTRRQEIPPSSGRAIGWDTPSVVNSSAGDYFSEGSYGHTGFTGTSVWIDPNRRIAIILLTNRVHPTRKRGGMKKVRRDFHNAVMEALLERPSS
ncbi:MAG: glycoside hydrolase family 3 N-terminal domain-containing protein [Candidatus Neomarinimicrobiota bacterium]|nr:glycoside hydrolase family 3 N-terminal domain-containing protein [Candidatus Neomarinimicrobiota bacterium]